VLAQKRLPILDTPEHVDLEKRKTTKKNCSVSNLGSACWFGRGGSNGLKPFPISSKTEKWNTKIDLLTKCKLSSKVA
jgi:hypothetical protein